MCGIAGFIGTAAAADFPVATLRAMADAIAHRGPDGEGYFEAAGSGGIRVGLAHRRLAIIDLSTGDQPMGNETGRIQIVFNGEIYNFQVLRERLRALGHVFRTASDTETIVHAYEQWGDDCVTHLRGMFAFALWDGDRERLLLARDRFGEKPLYLKRQGGMLLFGSEIKSLLAVTGTHSGANHGALRDYLLYRYVPGPNTLFEGVTKLMPGTIGVWEKGQFRTHRYFTPADREVRVESPLPADPVEHFLAKLDESVRIRMVSDVPFGAFLSGGLDSSAIVALMCRHSFEPVKTFTVGFAETEYSELDHARVIANRYRTDHHELLVSQTQLMDYLPAMVRYRDAPVAEPSDIPIYLLSVEARRTVKMVLTGEGADEFLGGYPKHVYENYAHLIQMMPRSVRRRAIEPLVRKLPYQYHRSKTAAVTLSIDSHPQRMVRWFGAISELGCDRLFGPRSGTDEPVDTFPFDVAPGNSALRSILYFDQTSWLPDNLLERGDRMTMAASLEARMPFMDHELAASISALPDAWRVRGIANKRILRMAVARLLPRSVVARRKVGFRVPVNEWFRGSMREYLHDHLTGTDSHTRDYFRPEVLQRYLREHMAGRQNHEKLLWSLLSLEIWHREYGVRA
jgi:asparagine synthase (glutamine-hydrolysing)